MSAFRPLGRDQQLPRGRGSRPSRTAANNLGITGPQPARSTPAKPARTASGAENWLYGRHAVAAALANPARRWRRLVVLAGQEEEGAAYVAGARAKRCGDAEAIYVLDRNSFGAMLPVGAVHQGLALEVEPLPERDLDEVVQDAATATVRPVILVLDQLSDPRNVGSVLRSAAAFGALAVVLPAHGAPPVTGALAKAASGALERVPLVRVVNLARSLDRLKRSRFWICGLDESAQDPLSALDLGERVVIVLGSEGGGIRRLLRERCDFLARLPTLAAQPSLNVSNAAAVALYELVRRGADG